MMARDGRHPVLFDGLHSIPESNAVVAIDVIRATTTAVTAVATGRQCYPVPTVEAAEGARKIRAGCPYSWASLAGVMAAGFDMTNSPAELATRTDRRPIILLSSSGTQLIHGVRGREHVFIACFPE